MRCKKKIHELRIEQCGNLVGDCSTAVEHTPCTLMIVKSRVRISSRVGLNLPFSVMRAEKVVQQY